MTRSDTACQGNHIQNELGDELELRARGNHRNLNPLGMCKILGESIGPCQCPFKGEPS